MELLHVTNTGTISKPLVGSDESKFAPGKDIEADQTEVMENPYTVTIIDKKTDATVNLQLTAVTDDDQL